MRKFFRLGTALSFFCLTAAFGLASASSAATKTADAPALRSIAFEHYLSGDTEAALDFYQKAIDTAAHDYGAESSYIGQLYYEMGTLALDAKKFVRSESYLQKAVQHNPNSVMARVKFAEVLQMRGKNEEALQQIHGALAKHGNSPEAREALVIWLQTNKKTAHAIHESFHIAAVTAGHTVPPLVVPQSVLASKPIQASPGTEQTLIASAAPAPPAPAASKAKAPLKLFSWMTPKQQDEKKAEPEKKPEKKEDKKEEKKKEEKREDKRPPEKRSEKKTKSESSKSKSAKDKNKRPKSKETKPTEVITAGEELHASAAALRTTAKTIPKRKEVKQSNDDPAESGESKTEEAQAAPAKPKHVAAQAAPQPTMVFNVPVVKPSKRSNTMVPPPPPMVPVFNNPMSGMFQAPPPPLTHAAPAKVSKKPKPAPVTKEPAPESRPASSSGGSEEDPNFLLDWAGANAKKKGK